MRLKNYNIKKELEDRIIEDNKKPTNFNFVGFLIRNNCQIFNIYIYIYI